MRSLIRFILLLAVTVLSFTTTVLAKKGRFALPFPAKPEAPPHEPLHKPADDLAEKDEQIYEKHPPTPGSTDADHHPHERIVMEETKKKKKDAKKNEERPAFVRPKEEEEPSNKK
jgi:hypothetical protein